MVKNISKTKSAFSLPEVLMVLAIVGLITVIMLITSKPTEHIIGTQYRRALNSLEIAAFNAHDNCITGNCVCSDTDPGCTFLSSPANACEQLASYVNTTAKNCTANEVSNVDKYTFIASNSARYTVHNEQSCANNEQPCRPYFVVTVDINGDRRPNTSTWTRASAPDIVYFVVSHDGEVGVLGYPRNDDRYIRAKVVYADYENNENSRVRTYKDAQCEAFGEKYFLNDVYSVTGDETWLKGPTNFKNSAIANSGGPMSNQVVCRQLVVDFDGSLACGNQAGVEFPRCTLEIVY